MIVSTASPRASDARYRSIFRIAREIDAGTIWINDWAVIYDECEEGGFKQSGLGRMNGIAVIDDFIEYKHVTLSHGAVAK